MDWQGWASDLSHPVLGSAGRWVAWGTEVTLCPDSSLSALDKQLWGWRSLWL